MPSSLIRPACDISEGPRIAPGPLSRRGIRLPLNAECRLLAAALLGGTVVAAGTGAALAGRVTSFALPGAGTHAGGRARLHLAGFHPVRFHLVRFHVATAGGSARSDVAFARSSRSRLHLRRRDRRRPNNEATTRAEIASLDRMGILLLWVSDAGIKTCGADLGSRRIRPRVGATGNARLWIALSDVGQARKIFSLLAGKRCENKVCYDAPRKRFGRCARSRRQAWRPEGHAEA